MGGHLKTKQPRFATFHMVLGSWGHTPQKESRMLISAKVTLGQGPEEG